MTANTSIEDPALNSEGHLSTEALFRRHAGFVARFLARLGVTPDQLDDTLQEVFLVAHRNGGYLPGIAKPTSYLAGIAIRAAARQRRKLGVARQRCSEAPLDQLAADSEDPARALQVQQDLRRLQRALERLPEDLRTALVLVELEGQSCVSVAAALGCPVGTVYWRLHQARKELQAALRALDAPRRIAPPAARVQPARSFMLLFGCAGSHRTQASPVLQVAQTLLEVGPIAAGATALVAICAAVSFRAVQPNDPPHALIATSAADESSADATSGTAARAIPLEQPGAPPEDAGAKIARVRRARPGQTRRHLAPVVSATQATPEVPNVRPELIPATEPHDDELVKPAPPQSAIEPPRATPDRELLEMREIQRAERLLSDEPARALELTRSIQAGFPDGNFCEERAYLEVRALRELGRMREVREKAAAFLRRYPASLYSGRVRSAAAGEDP